jgi:nicotinate-nucleotide pyrophosphorylase (carboxylating)
MWDRPENYQEKWLIQSMSDPYHDFEAIVTADVSRALAEDVGTGDLTAALIPAHARGHATVMTRETMILAGVEWFNRAFTHLDPDCDVFWNVREGDRIEKGAVLCAIDGNARAMLTAERTALNFVQMLSAVATKVRLFVEAVAGTRAKIVDTRKTLPGLRLAQKYAVRVGGGTNHRVGLYDGILIKENHIAAAGGVSQVLKEAFRHAPDGALLEIEVENLDQLREALTCGARMVLIDNFEIALMREAVAIAQAYDPGVELEASGGVSLTSVHNIAQTGVHRISIGTLTKDIDAVDLSMRFRMHD